MERLAYLSTFDWQLGALYIAQPLASANIARFSHLIQLASLHPISFVDVFHRLGNALILHFCYYTVN
jgi:hypothetical protein